MVARSGTQETSMSTHDVQADPPARDLPIMQALTSVRQHPEWFFPGRQFETAELVGLLATECLRSGVRDLAVEQSGRLDSHREQQGLA
jgi:hypothetical protein